MVLRIPQIVTDEPRATLSPLDKVSNLLAHRRKRWRVYLSTSVVPTKFCLVTAALFAKIPSNSSCYSQFRTQISQTVLHESLKGLKTKNLRIKEVFPSSLFGVPPSLSLSLSLSISGRLTRARLLLSRGNIKKEGTKIRNGKDRSMMQDAGKNKTIRHLPYEQMRYFENELLRFFNYI